VRVVPLPSGQAEERKVRLGPTEEPRLCALKRRVDWLAERIEALRESAPEPLPANAAG
jgi:hypothetical protein